MTFEMLIFQTDVGFPFIGTRRKKKHEQMCGKLLTCIPKEDKLKEKAREKNHELSAYVI